MPPFVPGNVPGANWACPRDKPGFAGLPLCKIRRKPGFVSGFHRVCPKDKPGEIPGKTRGRPKTTGQKSLCLCACFLPEILLMGGTLMGGERFLSVFYMTVPCRWPSGERHRTVMLWSCLIKTRGVASLWRYGVCLSHAEGHPAVTDPRFPPPPQQKNPKNTEATSEKSRAGHFQKIPF